MFNKINFLGVVLFASTIMLGNVNECFSFCTQDSYKNIYRDKTEVKEGKVLYQTYCASCHRDNGEGVDKVFPPLKQNEWVKDENKFIDVVLNGTDGGMEIDGVRYYQSMPAFRSLKDEEISRIVNYVRTSFGNNYKREIKASKVQKARKQ